MPCLLPLCHIQGRHIKFENCLHFLALRVILPSELDDLAYGAHIETAALHLGVDLADVARNGFFFLLRAAPLSQRTALAPPPLLPSKLDLPSSDIPQIGLGTSQILPKFGSLGKAEPSRLCANRALFMRPGWLAPKAATFL